MTGRCVIEKENADLYKMAGKLIIQTGTFPITVKNFIPRGCNLKNTEWIYGLVVYSGSHTKIMMNAVKSRPK